VVGTASGKTFHMNGLDTEAEVNVREGTSFYKNKRPKGGSEGHADAGGFCLSRRPRALWEQARKDVVLKKSEGGEKRLKGSSEDRRPIVSEDTATKTLYSGEGKTGRKGSGDSKKSMGRISFAEGKERLSPT